MNNKQLIGSKGKSFQLLPRIQNLHQVDKILNELSSRRQNTSQTLNAFKNNYSLSLKLYKYDLDAKEKCRLQLQTHNSPQKWKVPTNCNSQFKKQIHSTQNYPTQWDIERTNLAKRSYDQPKQFHGIKSDYFSRQFPQDLTKANSKKYNKKLKQIQLQYENKVFEGRIKRIEERSQKSIEAIRSKGTRFQLSKEKLFGFVNPVRDSPKKHLRFNSTISAFRKQSSPSKFN